MNGRLTVGTHRDHVERGVVAAGVHDGALLFVSNDDLQEAIFSVEDLSGFRNVLDRLPRELGTLAATQIDANGLPDSDRPRVQTAEQ